MADFVAVIRKAVDGLADNTSENRERVYEKARRAVRRQLENMSPRPSEEVVSRQLDKLDTAIREVELEHVEALPAGDGDLSALSLDGPRDSADTTGEAAAPDKEPEGVEAPTGSGIGSAGDTEKDQQAGGPSEDDDEAPKSTIFAVDDPESDEGRRATQDAEGTSPDSPFGDPHEEILGIGASGRRVVQRKRARRRQLVIAAIAFFAVVAVAFGLWSNRKALAPMIAGLTASSSSTGSASSESGPGGSGQKTANAEPGTDQSGTAAEFPANKAGTPTGENGAAASKNEAGNEPANGLPEGGKYTQRLMPDGSETDPGPAPQTGQPQEGSSVSAQTAGNDASAGSGSSAPGAGNGQKPTTATAAGEQAAISQKMYLYEQRFGDQKTATTTVGSVVWSLARDNSDGSGKPATVIHGEISVPEKGITALMTIKPNTDPSLPASHLIELVFALPGDFPGGGIASIERVALKQTEQDRGNALIGVPAKITDNFFMIALNDYSQAVEKNVELLKSRNWIDIPIAYTNGRRALITLEKGSSGSQVFDEAFKDWATQKTDGADASTGTGSTANTPSSNAGPNGGSSASGPPPAGGRGTTDSTGNTGGNAGASAPQP